MNLPTGPFATIVADPPWDYGARNDRSSAAKHYATMSNHEIAALPVVSVVAINAHLYLWVTNPRLYGPRNGPGPSPKEIMEAWGFRYITALTWLKTGGIGLGYYFRGDTEHVLFGVRGARPIAPAVRERNWFEAPRSRHSAKPLKFYQLVQRVSPSPRLEMFARSSREGWAVWGNDARLTAPTLFTGAA